MRCCWYAIVLSLGCVVSRHAAAQDKGKEAPLERIFADWKHRQGSFKTARWVIAGSTEYMDLPARSGNPVHPRHAVLLLDFVGKRYRLETSEVEVHKEQGGQVQIRPRVSTEAFDGADVRVYFDRVLNRSPDDWPDMMITDGTPSPFPGTGFEAYLWPVLYAHGLVPTINTYLRMNKLSPGYDPEEFKVGKQQTIDDQQFTLVRTEQAGSEAGSKYDEVWINRSQKSTIHRYVYFRHGKLSSRLDVEWKQTGSGWRPEKWTLTRFRDEIVERIDRLRVESFAANPAVADTDFTLEAKPGMKVLVTESPPPGKGLKPFLPASKTYRILPSSAWRLVAAEGFTTAAGKKLPPEVSPEPDRAWIWWTVAGVVLLGGGVVYRFRRKQTA